MAAGAIIPVLSTALTGVGAFVVARKGAKMVGLRGGSSTRRRRRRVVRRRGRY